MILSKLLKLTCFCALVFWQFDFATYAAETRVLLLSSYHSEFPSAAHHLEAVSDLLKVKDRHLEVVYMDTKRHTVAQSAPITYEKINLNTSESGPYDVIISSDDNALEFLLRYKNELMGEIPVIFFGINNVELAQRAIQQKEYWGILEQASLNRAS
jgi:hypothetical protein